MKPNLFQSHCADNLSAEFSKQGMALNIRIGFTQYVQRLFYLKFFYKPLHISRYHFPHNVLNPVSAGSPCTHYTETMLRSFLTERKFGSSFSRRVFSSALLRVCLLPSVFAYLSKTAMVIPIAVSSWDMLLLESGFLLNRNSLGALSEDGDWSWSGPFMRLSHPINGHTPKGQLSLSKHPYLSTAWSTRLCADSYSKLKLYHPGVAGTSSCSPAETSLSFKIHSVTNKRKSDFDTGCLLKNQICSFR